MTPPPSRLAEISGTLTQPQAKVLSAVLWASMDGPVTVRAVCRHAGLSSSSSGHYMLRKLRAMGLIDWEDGREATIRPAFTIHIPGGSDG